MALQTYLEIKDPTRESQREANRTKKISHGKKTTIKKKIKEENQGRNSRKKFKKENQ